MINREEVLKGLVHHRHLEASRNELNHDECFDCPYRPDGEDTCASLDRMINDALELLNEQQPQWISVKDRLPEPGMSVIIYGTPNEDPEHTDGKIAITHMSEWNYLNSQIKTEPYWIMPWQYFSFDYTITHWMPLPEPPKGVKQDGET